MYDTDRMRKQATARADLLYYRVILGCSNGHRVGHDCWDGD